MPDSQQAARLLLYPQNRVLCRLGDAKFDDGLGWNLDFLLRLWIEARACLSLLLHQLSKTGQYKFAVLFDHFVREVAERIEEYSSGSFVCLGGSSECNLKFSFGHVWPLFMAAQSQHCKIIAVLSPPITAKKNEP
jgi:hypothetical protein